MNRRIQIVGTMSMVLLCRTQQYYGHKLLKKPKLRSKLIMDCDTTTP